MTGLINHLWQSTAFAAVIALAAWAMRRNSPRARYRLWLASSLKFLVPFSLIVSTGAVVALPVSAPVLKALPVETVAAYFAPMPIAPVPMNPAPGRMPFDGALWLGVLWLGGAIFLIVRRVGQWRALRGVARAAHPVGGSFPIPVLESEAGIEPGVFGLFRPVILVPAGLARTLPGEQWAAILRHELCHVRHRDNLTAAVHMAVETAFWFFPPVWWIGAKMMEERERDCDAAALAEGGNAGEYVRGILRVCEGFVASPLPCASGIAGADLKKRVREILSWRGARPVGMHVKLALAMTAALAVLVPFAIGVARGQSVPASRLRLEAASIKPAAPGAQTQLPTAFDAVSIKPAAPGGRGGYSLRISPGGRFSATRIGLRSLLALALDLTPSQQIEGLPAWAKDRYYSIEAVAPPGTPELPQEENWDMERTMVQSMLAQRFHLRFHRATRQEDVYDLQVAKGGPKLPRLTPDRGRGRIKTIPGLLNPNFSNIPALVGILSQDLGKPVIDKTGLTDQYDFFALSWMPGPGERMAFKGGASDQSGPSVFAALQQQLGLRLVAGKGPVDVIVIDHIEPAGTGE